MERIVLNNAKVVFPYFAERHFGVIIDETLATTLNKWGRWKPKIGRLDDGRPWLRVRIGFVSGGHALSAESISFAGMELTENDMYKTLDDVDIEDVDVVLDPQSWEIKNKTGSVFYVRSLKVRE